MESLAGDLNQMQRTPLHASHVEALRKAGRIRSYAAGEMVGEVGTPMDEFIYLLEGKVDVLDIFTRKPFLPHSLLDGLRRAPALTAEK